MFALILEKLVAKFYSNASFMMYTFSSFLIQKLYDTNSMYTRRSRYSLRIIKCTLKRYTFRRRHTLRSRYISGADRLTSTLSRNRGTESKVLLSDLDGYRLDGVQGLGASQHGTASQTINTTTLIIQENTFNNLHLRP